MSLLALILSRDPQVVDIFRDVMWQFGISLRVTQTREEALHELARQKFEAVVVDSASANHTTEVLRSMRRGQANRTAIGVVVVESGSGNQEAFHEGANFVLEAPITSERVVPTLRAALGLMLRERRQYFRYPLDVPARTTLSDGGSFECRVDNISEGGMALTLTGPTTVLRGQVSVTFTFPQSQRPVTIFGDVTWLNQAGEAGVRFRWPSRSAKAALQRWIRIRMESPQS